METHGRKKQRAINAISCTFRFDYKKDINTETYEDTPLTRPNKDQ